MHHTVTDAELHVFFKITEEASELSQAVCKVAKFGWNSIDPKSGENNMERVLSEYHDLQAALAVLCIASPEFGKLVKATSHDYCKMKTQKLVDELIALDYAEIQTGNT